MKPVAGKYVITNVNVPKDAYTHLPSQDGVRHGYVVLDVTVAANNEESVIHICNYPQSSSIVSDVFRTRKEARAFLDAMVAE
jgi:hypothetical protein